MVGAGFNPRMTLNNKPSPKYKLDLFKVLSWSFWGKVNPHSASKKRIMRTGFSIGIENSDNWCFLLFVDDNSNQSSIADSSPVKQENSCSTSPAPEPSAASHRDNSETKTDQSPDSKRGQSPAASLHLRF